VTPDGRPLATLYAQRFLSAWIWFRRRIVALLWLPWLALVFVFTAPFDAGRYAAGRWFRRAAIVAVAEPALALPHLRRGRIDDPRRPYVAVSNHESIADIFLISHLPWEMKWLSKDANFRIPVMGWMMWMAGDIRLVRSDRNSRKQALDAVPRSPAEASLRHDLPRGDPLTYR
jgi:1-acyl-sn-glycerol-3-phosphate acyltransferase